MHNVDEFANPIRLLLALELGLIGWMWYKVLTKPEGGTPKVRKEASERVAQKLAVSLGRETELSPLVFVPVLMKLVGALRRRTSEAHSIGMTPEARLKQFLLLIEKIDKEMVFEADTDLDALIAGRTK